MMQGCYEGDSLEPLGLRVGHMTGDFGLEVHVQTIDKIVEIDLLDAKVEDHFVNKTNFSLVQRGVKIFFKVFFLRRHRP